MAVEPVPAGTKLLKCEAGQILSAFESFGVKIFRPLVHFYLLGGGTGAAFVTLPRFEVSDPNGALTGGGEEEDAQTLEQNRLLLHRRRGARRRAAVPVGRGRPG